MGDYKPIPSESPMADVIKELRQTARRQADSTSGQLHNTQGRIQEQIDFLLHQSIWSWASGTWQDTSQTAGTGSWQWLEYEPRENSNGAMDYRVKPFITTSTGSFRVTLTADLMLNNGHETAWAGMCVAPEIMRLDDGSIFDEGRGGVQVQALNVNLGASVRGIHTGAIRGTYSNSRTFTLEPFTQYFVRTRRAIMKPADGPSWGGVYYVSIQVELMGM